MGSSPVPTPGTLVFIVAPQGIALDHLALVDGGLAFLDVTGSLYIFQEAWINRKEHGRDEVYLYKKNI